MNANTLTRLGLLTLHVLSLSACFDVHDLVEAEPERDAAAGHDAAAEHDAAANGADAGDEPPSWNEPDSGQATDAAPPPVACDATHPCSADGVCAPDGFCAPRCPTPDACIVASSPRGLSQLTTDGDSVYYFEAPSRDALGNSRNDGTLRRLVGGTQEVLVADRSVYSSSLQIAAEHVYWHEARHIWRVAKAGSSAPEELYESKCDQFLVLSDGRLALQTDAGLAIGSSDGTEALRTIATPRWWVGDDQPLQTYGCGPLRQGGTEIFHFEKIAFAQLQLLGTNPDTGVTKAYGERENAVFAIFEVRPPYRYEYYGGGPGGGFATRRRLDEAYGYSITVARGAKTPAADGFQFYDFREAWVYYVASGNDQQERPYFTLARASLTDIGTVEELAPASFAPPRTFGAEEFRAGEHKAFLLTSGYASNSKVSLLYQVALPSKP